MQKRIFAVAATMALVLAACSQGPSQSNGENPDGPGAVEAPEAMLLSYSLADGGTLVYEVSLDQNIEISAEGDGAALEGEELPESADVNLTGTGQFTFDVADGPEEGTYEVTITGTITDLAVSGTVDGEPVDGEEVPDFAEMEPVSVTLIVDEKGNVIPQEPTAVDPFGGLMGGLEGLGGMGAESIPGANLGQFFGPPFGEEAVTVGDSWSTSFDTPGFGSEPITTSVESEVTGTDTVDGSPVLVIESTATTGGFEIDLAQFFIGLLTGFLPEDASPEEQAQVDLLVENLRFAISSDDAVSNSTTYFDSEAGVTRRHELTAQSSLAFDLNFPDEETGELTGLKMTMAIDQNVSYNLVTGPSA